MGEMIPGEDLLGDHARFAGWKEPTVALCQLDVLLARTGIHTCLFRRDVRSETLLLHWRCFGFKPRLDSGSFIIIKLAGFKSMPRVDYRSWNVPPKKATPEQIQKLLGRRQLKVIDIKPPVVIQPKRKKA